MNLSFKLAASLSLSAALLLVAPVASAQEPTSVAPATATAPLPAAAPVVAPPGDATSSAPPPGAPGPIASGSGLERTPLLESHRASPPMIVGGAVTTALGLTAAVLGATLFSAIENASFVCGAVAGGLGAPTAGCSARQGGPIAGMVVGGLAMAGGVTMIVLGARKVTTPRSEASVLIRPTGAAFRVTF